MAVSEKTEEFFNYAKKNVGKGRNSVISPMDKVSSPFVISKYKTWGELYDAAEKEYRAQGGIIEGDTKSTDDTDTPIKPGFHAYGRDPLGSTLTSRNLAVTIDASGNAILSGSDGTEHYLYVETYTDSSGKKQSHINVSSDIDVIFNKAIADYQKLPGGLNTLFESLYKKNLITKETFNSKNISAPDFKKGLVYAIRQHGVSAADANKFNQKLTVDTLGTFLASSAIAGTGKGGTVTDIHRQETTRPDSDEEANRFAMEFAGRSATKAEKDAYFAVLSAAEKKAVVKSTSTTGDSTRSGVDSGSFIDQTDKTLMLGKIFADSIAGSDLDTIIKTGAGAAQGINNIKTYAKRYGVTMSDESAMAEIVSNMKTGKDLKATQAKILRLSKLKYGNLANFIDEDTSVEDIASETIYKVSQLTGVPYKSLSVNHAVVAKALANGGKPGVMTEAEVGLLVRTDPSTKQLWLKTPAAMEEASEHANVILSMFGLRA